MRPLLRVMISIAAAALTVAAVLAVAPANAAAEAEEGNPADGAAEEPADEVATCRGVTATIVGTDTDDVLVGTAEDDVIVAGKGNDLVFGGAGNDIICGNGGADTLWGETGRDLLLGGGGADTLIGGEDRDSLQGGQGADRCEAPFPGERRHRSCIDRLEATQNDLPAARNLLEASRAKWAAWLIEQDTDDYGFDTRLSCECEPGAASIDILDGAAYWRSLTGSLAGDRTIFTVDDLFDRADDILDILEEDHTSAGDPETGIGLFFSLSVDAGTGFPYLVGDNSPTDGGVDYVSTPRSAFQGTLKNTKNGYDSYTLGMLALANPVPEIDELISIIGTGFPDDFATEVIAEHGAPCADLDAADTASCEANLALLADDLAAVGYDGLADESPDGFFDAGCGNCIPTVTYMVARSGADLSVVPVADWLDALGTIDRPAEVPFVLKDNAKVKPRRNGYLAVTSNYIAECDPIVSREELHRVRPSGSFGTLRVAYSLEYLICF